MNAYQNSKIELKQNFSLSHGYPVVFSRSIFTQGKVFWSSIFDFSKSRKVGVYVDKGVVEAHPIILSQIQDWASSLNGELDLCFIEVVQGGESCKNQIGFPEKIAKQCLDHNLCRHSYILCVGGGALLDAVGFAASITHRGIRFVRVPTTVLAQNDSGVGVKNGVNRFGIKNFLGTFTLPDAVVNDFNFIDLLDDRTYLSGIAEAFKVAIIKDKKFLDWLISNVNNLKDRVPLDVEYMIHQTAKLHLEHIGKGGDPFEYGSSRPLDFGHWSAHKLEALTNHELLHGEAVAIGIALDLNYAAAIGLIATEEAHYIIHAMKQLGLPIVHPIIRDTFNAVWDGLEEFREHIGGELCIAMPQSLGHRTDIYSVDKELMFMLARQL